MSETIRDRSLRLFRFLEQLTEMQAKAVRNLTSYDQVLWFNEIPQNPQYCDCVAWNGNAKKVKAFLLHSLNKTHPCQIRDLCFRLIHDLFEYKLKYLVL